MSQMNPQKRLVAIPASGSPLQEIDITVNGTPYVRITETAIANTPQGILYTLPDDGNVQQYPLTPGDSLELGNHDAMGRPGAGRGLGFAKRPDVGNPGVTIPATQLCQMVSATATATQVLVEEWKP